MLTALTQQTKQAIGLDVGTFSVKAIVLDTRNDTPSLKTMATCPILDSSEIREPSDTEINQAIHKCLEQLPGKENYAVTGLSGHDVVVRSFAFPNLSEKEIDGAVKLGGPASLPLRYSAKLSRLPTAEKSLGRGK